MRLLGVPPLKLLPELEWTTRQHKELCLPRGESGHDGHPRCELVRVVADEPVVAGEDGPAGGDDGLDAEVGLGVERIPNLKRKF